MSKNTSDAVSPDRSSTSVDNQTDDDKVHIGQVSTAHSKAPGRREHPAGCGLRRAVPARACRFLLSTRGMICLFAGTVNGP